MWKNRFQGSDSNDDVSNPDAATPKKDPQAFSLPTGFTPPASHAYMSAGSPPEPVTTAAAAPVPQPTGSHSTLFESCQSELIDLQEQFKKELLSMKEVEEKFEAWKRRPELSVARLVEIILQKKGKTVKAKLFHAA